MKRSTTKRRTTWRILTASTVVALSVTGGTVAASAVYIPPNVTDTDRTLVQRVDDTTINGKRIGAMGGLEIVGSDAYVLKADTETGWSTLYRIDEFNTPNAVTYPRTVVDASSAPADLGHANGLAYYRTPGADPSVVGSFYVPTLKALGDYQVAQVSSAGVVTAHLGARVAGVSGSAAYRKIASITHYQGSQFIVRTERSKLDPNDSETSLKEFFFATINSSGDFVLTDPFWVPTTMTYKVGQDITYDSASGELLFATWNEASNLNNRIVVVDVPTSPVTQPVLPKRWIKINVSSADAAKFEVEGLDRDGAGKLFVASNIVKTDAVTWIDGIHKITGK